MWVVRWMTLKGIERNDCFNNEEMARAYHDGIKSMWNAANVVSLEIIKK